jgi:hypothetical protein
LFLKKHKRNKSTNRWWVDEWGWRKHSRRWARAFGEALHKGIFSIQYYRIETTLVKRNCEEYPPNTPRGYGTNKSCQV